MTSHFRLGSFPETESVLNWRLQFILCGLNVSGITSSVITFKPVMLKPKNLYMLEVSASKFISTNCGVHDIKKNIYIYSNWQYLESWIYSLLEDEVWVLKDVSSFLMTGSEEVLQGKTQLFFSTHPAPEGMVCHVQPSSGFEVHTHFSIFCTSGKEVCKYVGYHHLHLYHLTFEPERTFLMTQMHFINILCK